MIQSSFNGFGCAIKGIQLITRPGVRRYVIIPLAINLLLFSLAIYLLGGLFDQAINYLIGYIPDWLGFIKDALVWLLWPLFAIMIFFLVFYTFTYIASLLAAPFNGLLAEKVETLVRGGTPEGSLLPTWKMIVKSIGSIVSSLWYVIKWSVLLLIISFIPVINIAAPVLWFGFGAWVLALNYLDPPMGNHDNFFNQVIAYARQRKSLSLGFGSAMVLLTSIPVLNFIAIPAGVAGATYLWVKQEQA